MSKVYKKYNSNYTTVDNSIFKEKNMTLKAKGLFCLMWSLPNEWEFSIRGLATLSKDGERAVRSALKELELYGYLKRVQRHNNKGFDGYDYILSDIPMKDDPRNCG